MDMDKYFDYRKHETILDYLMEGFLLLDFSWRFLYVNQYIVKNSRSSSKKDLIGYTVMEKYPGIEHTELFKVLQKCMNERVAVNYETEFVFPDKTSDWFELRIEPIPEGLFILSLNITNRKKTENENRDLLQALEKMIFITSHKVRQPITNIIGLANSLKSGNLPEEELIRIAKHMKESALILDTFTKELVNFIQQQKPATNKSADNAAF